MRFTLNKPFETAEATVDVDAGLAPGAYRFRLEVLDNDGNRSRPTVVTVTVEPRLVVPPIVPPVIPTRPTPVVTPTPITPTPITPIRGGNPT